VNPEHLSLVVAFGAGVLSFVSPCCLPLVPAYVGHLAGRTLGQDGPAAVSRGHTLAHAVAFVLGFTTIFVALGATVGAIGFVFQDAVKSLAFRVVAGGVLVVIGLHAAGLLRIDLLYRDTRLWRRAGARVGARAGLASSFAVGVIFAAGWTPCIGPILGTILTVGMAQGTLPQAVLLLTAYSLGLGVPFLLAGYGLEAAARVIRRRNRFGRAVELVSGGLMVAMGFLVAFNVLSWIAATAYRLGYTGV
jgi:cytochrome c-type biogenesis protein